MTTRQWFKPSRCSGGSCVEVARDGDEFLVRDSKRPGQTPLQFTGEEMAEFFAAVKAGEFDQV